MRRARSPRQASFVQAACASERLVAEKRTIIYDLIEHHLARFPASKQPDPKLGLTVDPITHTPFVVLYDYDEAELRVHFILPARADRSDLDPASAEW